MQGDEQYADADLIIASDGLNSRIRARYAATLPARHRPAPTAASSGSARTSCSTPSPSPSRRREHGWFQAHAYRFDDDTSTFIVETPEERLARAGLDTMEKEESIAFCEKLFAKYLDGHALMSNAAHLRGSAQWINFPRVVCERWVHSQRPRAGGADGRRRAHRALLDRLGHQARARGRDRARALHRRSDPATCAGALQHYEAVRSVEVLRIQNAARNSTEWFENVDALRRPAARAVRLFAAHAQPAHQPREPAPARPGLRRGLRGLDRRSAPACSASRRSGRCRRCSRRSRCAASR